MAKKPANIKEESGRQTRKEILIARKQAQQTRRIRWAMGGVAALIALLFVIAIMTELVINPGRAVATVGDQDISFRDFQRRVRYERAQRILLLENQLEAFGGDVGIIQQFAGQMIVELTQPEVLAQGVLDQMVDEEITRQLADARGITVSEEEIDELIGSSFNYFGGDSPTPLPSPTETVMPTPSLTPVPTAVITDVLPTATPFPTPTTGPTSTPRPTATPVSTESFQEQLEEVLAQFDDLDVDEATYRSVVRSQIYRTKLIDVLAIENELPDDALHASLFLLTFQSEEESDNAATILQETDFLTVWNTLRSAPDELDIAGTASELLWRTQEDLANSIGDEAASIAFEIGIGEPSEPISRSLSAEASSHYIFQVSGREMRPLSSSALEQEKFELYSAFIDGQLAGNLATSEFWRSRVPVQPVLDPKFLAQPTATPIPLSTPVLDPVPAEPTP
jgi:hypothetical protein